MPPERAQFSRYEVIYHKIIRAKLKALRETISHQPQRREVVKRSAKVISLIRRTAIVTQRETRNSLSLPRVPTLAST